MARTRVVKPFRNFDGQRYGSLVILRDAGFSEMPCGQRARLFNCQCDCGNRTVVRLGALRSGQTTSCGCAKLRHLIDRSTKHGHKRKGQMTGTYSTWIGMRQRCCNPRSPRYMDYGGRGIGVCDRWLNSFENFLEDMGEKPEGLTLERVNNNGDYEPGNCIWGTYYVQGNNTRCNVRIWNGESYSSMKQFAKAFGIPYHTFRELYIYKKMSVEQILLAGNYLE